MTSSNVSNYPLVFTGLNLWHDVFSPTEYQFMSYGCGGREFFHEVLSWKKLQTTISGKYRVTNDFPCLYEKGGFFMNSSTDGRTELSQWFSRSAADKIMKCMRFNYIIFGKGSQLRVLQTIPGVGEDLVWIDDNTSIPAWNYGAVSIGMVTKFKITFRGQFQANSPGYLAIGGFYFKDGYCTNVKTYTEKACSRVLTNLSGIITSPLYPAVYPPNTACTWHIRVPKGLVIRLSASIFDLQSDQPCNEDYITVYDGPSRDLSPIIGRYCEKYFPMLESSLNSMTLVFTSTSRLKCTGGFKFKYSTKVEPVGPKHSDRCPSSCQCFYVPGVEQRFVVEGKSLPIVPGNIPDVTAIVLFAENNIHRLKRNDFSSKKLLQYIDVSSNGLLYVDDKAFSALPSIQTIKLNMNFLRRLNQETFYNLSSLEVLDLAENLVSSMHPDTFSRLTNLKVLSLRSNFITTLDPRHFRVNSELQYLYIQSNQIQRLQDNVFRYLRKLKVLYLNHNKIKQISPHAFKGLRSLETLHIQSNKFAVVPGSTFSDIKKLQNLKVDYFMLCCYAKRFSPNVHCDAPVDEFSSCDDLMKNKAARASIWILGILAFLGNIGVVAWRLTLSEDNRVQSLLLTNLAVSDFLMGVYLLIIAIKDAQWQDVYFTKDFEWRNGYVCQFAGALSMLSSEVSVLILTVITADRLKSIVYPWTFAKLSYKSALVICLVVWAFGIIICLLPITGLGYFYDVETEMGFYGRSAVCLPVQLSTSRLAGWEYSLSIFIALNFVAFTFILSAYIAMFITVKRSSARTKSKNAKKEAAMAWKLMAIVLTDFCCWMPVIIIGILSITGNFHGDQGLAYVVIAVFVLPVNSSINPILYTFSNADVRKKTTTYFRTIMAENGTVSSTPFSAKCKTKQSMNDSREELKKLKLKEMSTAFGSDFETNGMGYLTCSMDTTESLWLLKYFTPEKRTTWIREVNVWKLLHKETKPENLISYEWHGEAKDLEIITNNVQIPGISLSPNSSVICFGFSSNYISLAKFLQESKSSADAEHLSSMVLNILKAVESLHRHGVSHGDIVSHNVAIERNRNASPIRVIFGGFDKASIVKSSVKSEQSYEKDIRQVGGLIEEMLSIYGDDGQFEEIKDVIQMCTEESPEWLHRITEIRCFFEKAMNDDNNYYETRF